MRHQQGVVAPRPPGSETGAQARESCKISCVTRLLPTMASQPTQYCKSQWGRAWWVCRGDEATKPGEARRDEDSFVSQSNCADAACIVFSANPLGGITISMSLFNSSGSNMGFSHTSKQPVDGELTRHSPRTSSSRGPDRTSPVTARVLY